jgi:hypothetical protein
MSKDNLDSCLACFIYSLLSVSFGKIIPESSEVGKHICMSAIQYSNFINIYLSATQYCMILSDKRREKDNRQIRTELCQAHFRVGIA